MSQIPDSELRKTVLPSSRREGKVSSEMMAPEMLDRDAAGFVENSETQPEIAWEGSEGGRGNHQIGLLVMGGLTCLAIVVGLVFYVLARNDSGPSAVAAPVATDDALPEHSVGNFWENSSAEEIRLSAHAAVKGFLNAPTVEDRCAFIHGGREHLAKLHHIHARNGEPKDAPGFSEFTLEQNEAVDGIPFLHIYALDSAGEEHIFNLFPSHDRMLIDWESSLCYGEMAWSELLEKKPSEPVLMRVFLRRFSVLEPGDPLDLVLLSERDDASFRSIYVDPESELAKTLDRVMGPGVESLHPYTLYLKWNTEERMPELASLKHLYWMDTDRLSEKLDLNEEESGSSLQSGE